jgi:Domain of unknown function (DUF1707)
VTDPGIRASDAEREEVAGVLGAAVGEGRLTLSEFSERVGRAHAARTRAELEALTADLPAAAGRADGDAPTSWQISPIGGVRRRGRWRLPRKTVSVGVIGGMDLDLSEAEFAAREVRILRIGIIGGIDVRVPAGVRVEVDGLCLLGGQDVGMPPTAPGAPTLRITAFQLIGGVQVRPTS